MQWELVLLAKIFRSTNRAQVFRELRSLGVADSLFAPTYRPVWAWLREHELHGKGLPTEAMLTARFPGVTFPDGVLFRASVEEDAVETIVMHLRERCVASIASSAGARLIEMAEKDPTAVPKFLQEVQGDVLSMAPVPHVVTVGIDVEEDLRTYDRFSEPGGVGLIFPYEEVGSTGLGLSPTGSYALYGDPGSKKTWTLLHWALWYWERGKRVLFFSQEMPWERLKWRAYALRGGFDWNTMSAGKVPREDLRRVIDEFRTTRLFHVRDPISVPDVRATAMGILDTFKPDVAFWDSSYLYTLQCGKESGLIRGSPYLAQEWMGFMKNLGPAYQCANFFTWQPNEQGEMFMTRTGKQDCDGVTHIETTDSVSTLTWPKLRDGVRDLRIRIDTTLCEGFGRVLRGMQLSEAYARARQQSTEEPEGGEVH